MAAAVLLRPQEWVAPRHVVCTVFWCGVLLIFTSIVLLVTSRHKGRAYQSWGSVFLGCGCCLLLICLLLCMHAYFVMSAATKSRHCQAGDLLDDDLDELDSQMKVEKVNGTTSSSGFRVAQNGNDAPGDVSNVLAADNHSTLYMNHCNTASSSYFIKSLSHETTNGYHHTNTDTSSPDTRRHGNSAEDDDDYVINEYRTRSPPLCRVRVLTGGASPTLAPYSNITDSPSTSFERNNYRPLQNNRIACDMVTSLDCHRLRDDDVSHERIVGGVTQIGQMR